VERDEQGKRAGELILERIENGEDMFGFDQPELWVRMAFVGKERP